MGAIGLRNGEVWGASGSAVLMVLRFAAQAAPNDDVAAVFDRVIAMNGFGLNLDDIEDPDLQQQVAHTLRQGATSMRKHLLELAELAQELEVSLPESPA